MLFDWFKKKQKTFLGIDLGSSGIKVVELSREEKDRVFLSNYAIGQTKIGSNENLVKMDAPQVAKLIRKILDQAGIKTKQVVISLPIGETFSTIISVPPMSDEELAKAIPFQARKYVPVPIEEVILDWSVVGEFVEENDREVKMPDVSTSGAEAPASEKQGLSPVARIRTQQILIVAVPREVIKKIAEIAKVADLKVVSIEQEAFSIVRSLIGKDEGAYLIIDFGQESVDLIVIDKNSIRLSNTFETNKLPDLSAEAAKMINLYEGRYKRKVGRVIMTGGGAGQSNLTATLSVKLGIPAGAGDPFARLAHEPKLDAALKEIAPFMAVAVGGAMREI